MATGLSLVVTILAGYSTRLSLVEAAAWVTHTDEVKLAIAGCQRALDHGDDELLRRSLTQVRRLTVDNARQQANVERAAPLLARGERTAVDELLDSMQAEEDRLMVERLQRIDSTRASSSRAFVAGAVLTLVFAAAAVVLVRAQRQELTRQRTLLQAIIESVDEGIIALEPSRTIIAINAVARSMWGGAAPRDRWPADWSSALVARYEDGTLMKPHEAPLARALRGEPTDGVVYHVAPSAPQDGDAAAGVWVSASARPIRDASGQTIAAVTTLRDVSEQREDVERLRDLSLTDEMTGLLNRRGFLGMANARLALARRTKAPIALLFADVNGLKQINDQLGHEEGDRAIKDAARTLRGLFREGDVVARLGGDEFVALLPNFAPAARDPLLARLAATIRAQVDQEPRPYKLSMSAGVTFMDWEGGCGLEELLAEADRLMYTRKRERAGQSSPVLRVVSPVDEG